MLVNPRVGQRVQVMEEYRDVWPVSELVHIEGRVAGVGNWPLVRFRGREGATHIPHKFLELIDD